MDKLAIADELGRFSEFWNLEKFDQCMENGGTIAYYVYESVDLADFADFAGKYINFFNRYDREFTVWLIQKTDSVALQFDPLKMDFETIKNQQATSEIS